MSTYNEYPLLSRLLASAVNISQKSAKILRDIKMSGNLNVENKGVDEFVTKADFQSQLNIVRSLEKQFPNLKIFGEEGDLKDEYNDFVTSLNENVLNQSKQLPDIYQSLKEEDLIVWVDPLDSTSSYIKNLDSAEFVTVLIGIVWKGKPIAGVISQPFFKDQNKQDYYNFGRVVWGLVGLGVFDLANGKINVPKNDTNFLRVMTTSSQFSILSEIPNSKFYSAGGVGYKALTLIDGKSDTYIETKNYTMRWDSCAPEALIRALDGTMTDLFGNEYSYFRNEETLIENCYGMIFNLNKDNSNLVRYLPDELKNQLLTDAELLKQRKQKK